MEINEIKRGLSFKRVTVVGITCHTDEQILQFAMQAAGENKSSLFDWTVEWNGGTAAVVTLNTD